MIANSKYCLLFGAVWLTPHIPVSMAIVLGIVMVVAGLILAVFESI